MGKEEEEEEESRGRGKKEGGGCFEGRVNLKRVQKQQNRLRTFLFR